jgi:transposase
MHPGAGRPGPPARPPAGDGYLGQPRRHHAGDLQEWAATQPWLVVEYLPSYAPELDPVEGLWANLNGCELANRCCADRSELIATAQVGSIRVRRDPELLWSFLAGAGLTL